MSLLLITAIALRAPLLFDDFWLDEIWNLNLARNANSLIDIFTTLKVDANHILNTVVLYIAGDFNSWATYRYVSLVSGILTILLLYRIGMYFDNKVAFTSAIISTVCFPLVLYSTEARGYSLSILFSLISFICLYKYIESKLKRYAVLFGFSAVMAMLSHFSFVYIYAAYLQWTIYYFLHENKKQILGRLAYLHFVPLTTFLLIYVNFILSMNISGANYRTWDHEVFKFVSLFFGLPISNITGSILLVICCVLVLWVTYLLYKKNSKYWPLFLLAILVNPVLTILASGYDLPQMRYFLLLLPFLILVVAIAFCQICQKYKTGKYVYWTGICLFVVSSLEANQSYSIQGRGEYLNTLRYISEESRNSLITISSNHDLRTITLLEFYRRYLPSSKNIKYVLQESIPENPSEWYLLQDFSSDQVNQNERISVYGINYNLVDVFYAANPDIMGWNWFVYRKEK